MPGPLLPPASSPARPCKPQSHGADPPAASPPTSAADVREAAIELGAQAPPEVKEAAVEAARARGPEYEEEEGRDFQGQPFTKCKPLLKLLGVTNPSFTEDDERWGPPMALRAVNHVAIGCFDVDAITRFYTKVLGFKEIPRPKIGFPGHWLKGCGIMLHIIDHDPQVPRRFRDWKDEYEAEPEAWFIRRGSHLAFEVEDFEEAEALLCRHGVEYSRHVLPDANMRQLFFYDPEGNGVEVGKYDDTWAFLRKHGEENGWLGE
ncbi:lactoylglutathione lyase [Micractinium conductrix]|uniref:Lactoylglutathione lyase n=1 Tax=Micractinium conductrix TaxID=554055 RepID=A0A2P6VCH8_9CHLO|nr:lactoylglutathione lyase [Micractinium conductrix]|eukprot:PSC71792.1 lactoylglutathione lyase [Micractinium conductrix]